MFHELHFYDVQVFIPDDRVDVKIQLDTSSLLEHSVFIRLSGSDQDWNKRDSDENSNYMRHILSYSQKKDLLIAHIFHFCKLGKDITELVDQVWDFRKYISQDSQISFKDTFSYLKGQFDTQGSLFYKLDSNQVHKFNDIASNVLSNYDFLASFINAPYEPLFLGGDGVEYLQERRTPALNRAGGR